MGGVVMGEMEMGEMEMGEMGEVVMGEMEMGEMEMDPSCGINMQSHHSALTSSQRRRFTWQREDYPFDSLTRSICFLEGRHTRC